MRQSIFVAAVFVLVLMAFYSLAQGNSSKPEITGQRPSPMTATQGTPVVIQLSNLIVIDPDPEPVYPNGFTLDINPGKNYRAVGNIVVRIRYLQLIKCDGQAFVLVHCQSCLTGYHRSDISGS